MLKDKLLKINEIKHNIKTAIQSKVNIELNDFESYADAINSIEVKTDEPLVRTTGYDFINFIDWNGEIIYSYTYEDLILLGKLPDFEGTHPNKNLKFYKWSLDYDYIISKRYPHNVAALYKPVNESIGCIIVVNNDLLKSEPLTIYNARGVIQYNDDNIQTFDVQYNDNTDFITIEHSELNNENFEIFIKHSTDYILEFITSRSNAIKAIYFNYDCQWKAYYTNNNDNLYYGDLFKSINLEELILCKCKLPGPATEIAFSNIHLKVLVFYNFNEPSLYHYIKNLQVDTIILDDCSIIGSLENVTSNIIIAELYRYDSNGFEQIYSLRGDTYIKTYICGIKQTIGIDYLQYPCIENLIWLNKELNNTIYGNADVIDNLIAPYVDFFHSGMSRIAKTNIILSNIKNATIYVYSTIDSGSYAIRENIRCENIILKDEHFGDGRVYQIIDYNPYLKTLTIEAPYTELLGDIGNDVEYRDMPDLEIIFPSTLISLFGIHMCSSVKTWNFSKINRVIDLRTSGDMRLPSKIIVPETLYNDYINHNKWSKYKHLISIK